MTFADYVRKQGLGEDDSMIDLVDCAIEHYEAHVRPMPGLSDPVADWYDCANAYADRVVAETFGA